MWGETADFNAASFILIRLYMIYEYTDTDIQIIIRTKVVREIDELRNASRVRTPCAEQALSLSYLIFLL